MRRRLPRCVCHGRRFCWWMLAQTAAFPFEHMAWERLPVLRATTAWMGV